MKWKKEFVEHLDSAESISMGLHTWKGSPFEEETPKHPIELVNAKYPDGWCVENCEEVIYDLNKYDIKTPYSGLCKYYGILLFNRSYADDNTWGDLITKSEYLQLTGREPLQRDWTGVIFKELHTDKLRQIGSKLDNGKYIITSRPSEYQFDIDRFFHSGIWIELKDEPINGKELIADPTYYTPNYLVDSFSTIHVQRPNTLEDRITKIEEQLKLILNGNK